MTGLERVGAERRTGARTIAASRDDQLERVALVDEPLELVRAPPRARPRRSAPRGRREDLRVRGRVDRLAVVPELLVQLLARARCRRTRSGRPGRAPCRRGGSCSRASSTICTGSPMSSTKTSPRPPIAPGLDDERRRLRDRHEVARHLGVRDRHRPAPLDLPPEDRDRRDPDEPSTLPKRTATKRVGDVGAARRTSRRSTRRAPSTGPSRSSGSPPCPSR